jgi:hypothetical protein
MAARVIARHPEQGWNLFCGGIIAFDDGGLLSPAGESSNPRPAGAGRQGTLSPGPSPAPHPGRRRRRSAPAASGMRDS